MCLQAGLGLSSRRMSNDMCSPEIDELEPNSLRSRGAVGLRGDVLVRARVVDV